MGALIALRHHELKVPEDVAVGCFGDIRIAALTNPFLTVVAHPAYEVGRQAMTMLLDRINGFDGPPRKQILPVSLVVRRSTQRR